MLGDGDELRVFNATGQRLALPAVEGLPFAPFVHDILNQVATAGRDYLSSCVGSTEGGGEDFNRLCFVHGSNMAQNRRDFNRCCATSLTVTQLLYQNVRKDRMPFLYLSGCNLQRSKEHKNHLFLMP